MLLFFNVLNTNLCFYYHLTIKKFSGFSMQKYFFFSIYRVKDVLKIALLQLEYCNTGLCVINDVLNHGWIVKRFSMA